MIYYHIYMIKYASNLCKIVLPLGKQQYKLLSIGVIFSLDNFQDKMKEMFQWFEFTCAYIYYILFIMVSECKYHSYKLELTLNKQDKQN